MELRSLSASSFPPCYCVKRRLVLLTLVYLLSCDVKVPPVEAKIVERDQDTFECLTEANPDANVTWSRSDGPLPQSAEADGGKLKLQSISSDLNGLYQCEASNQYGKKHSQLYVHVPSGSCTVCWVIFGLALIASCVVAAVVYYFKFLRNEESPQRVPTSEPEEAPGEADTNI
ncbi:nectin-4 isoform X4 [Parambassis ranga]|uniref:Nectin-4 isoform X4 n=1 Tax=Parambassis ranga TaxID=210632 RepID=A0A6P7HF92_9TELE|nr:nectin-4-like isoform X4 [Parambassis ranga]